MIMLSILLLIMLFIAIGLIAIPFYKNSSPNKLIIFITTVSFLVLFTTGTYLLTTNNAALSYWLSQGEKHYKLISQFDKLGGINGAIIKIKQRLEKNPEDAEGWFILGKLYLSQQNKIEAKKAFIKAHSFDPQDRQIAKFYNLVVKED